MDSRYKPLVSGGPVPTETIEDWNAIIASADKMRSHPDWLPGIRKLRFIDSRLEQRVGEWHLTLHLRPTAEASYRLDKLIMVAALRVFGTIFLDWG